MIQHFIASMSKKKSPEKPHFAFGSIPNTRPPPYSDLAHLSNEQDQRFVMALASIQIPEKPIVIRPPREQSEPVIPASEILKDLPQAEEGVKPCARIDCKEIIRKILNSTKRNRDERDDINYDMQVLQTGDAET